MITTYRTRVVFVLALGVLAAILMLAGLNPAEAAFPGSNGKIAFESRRDGPLEIHTITDGGTATRLTVSNFSSDPAYSPDGSRIAFRSGGALGYDIFVMNADGSGRRQLTDTGSAGSDGSAESEPAWSHDGSKIAFVSNSEIWVMNADGSDQHPITSNSYDDTEPAWSPDGSKIAFESSRRDLGDTDRNIYVMDANGNNQTNITANSPPGCSSNCYQGGDTDPAWSPDGSKIAYVHGYGPPTNPNAGGGLPNIWTMDPDGGNRTTLSNNPDVSAINPAWSPNGARIAYVGDDGPDAANIHVMNADGTGQGPIDTDTAVDDDPDWQPIPVCTKTVNAANDPLTGTAGKDVLCGDARNNTMNGAGGNDIILGEAGNDSLVGGSENDILNGGSGVDTALYTGTAPVAANLTTQFATGMGSDTLLGIERLNGSSAGDQLTGSGGANKLVGGAGADEILGLGGKDKLHSRDGAKNDTVNGGRGTDACTTDNREISIKSCE